MSFPALREWFDRVVDRSLAERHALYAAHGIDDALRDELEALLAARDHDVIGDRVERVAAATIAAALPERIGAWRVRGLIGEGGMGTVLAGERADGAFEMPVAIKLIRGHVSDAARERFVRERQVLAALAHPNIAALIDGGTTATGEPYLVMPYVDGEPLATWLARARPSLEARLSLFIALCHAVHYAHQHLVVHRDLKPGNILVRPDGTPVLLDFGIAKLLDPAGVDEATESAVMTPRYASPEQLLGRALTTATDVYGLGLVLFELVAGPVPDRGDRIDAATTELPAPSRIAAQVGAVPWRIEPKRLRGDLDHIVRRAARSEAPRRYPSALALAADVEAYLAGRPVAAKGGHAGYVLGKFVRRHALAVGAATLAIVALAGAFVQATIDRRRAVAAEAVATREAAAANATTDFLVDVFAGFDPETRPGRPLSVRETLDRGRDRLTAQSDVRDDLRARLALGLGSVYLNAGEPVAAIALLQPAIPALERAAGVDLQVRAMTRLARAHHDARQFEPGLAMATRADALATQALPGDALAQANAAMARGVAEEAMGQLDAAEATYRRAQALFERAGNAVGEAGVLHSRANVARARGHDTDALALIDQALARYQANLPDDHPRILRALRLRGMTLAQIGRTAEAEAAFIDLLARTQRVYGGTETGPIADVLNELGSVNQDLGHLAAAQDYYERSIAVSRAVAGGTDDLVVAQTANNLATLLDLRGDADGAKAMWRRSLDLREALLPKDHLTIAVPAFNLGRHLLLTDGDVAAAKPLIARAVGLRRLHLPAEHPLRLLSDVLDARVLLAEGDVAGATAALAALDAAVATRGDVPPPARVNIEELRAAIATARGDMATRRAALQRAADLSATVLKAGSAPLAVKLLALAEAELAAGDRVAARAHHDAIAPVLRAGLLPGARTLRRLDALQAALATR